jgi:hypothetical protein
MSGEPFQSRSIPYETSDTQPGDAPTARHEAEYHTYRGSRIPWYVRLIWILFWCFAAYYAIRYLFPDLRTELFNPP